MSDKSEKCNGYWSSDVYKDAHGSLTIKPDEIVITFKGEIYKDIVLTGHIIVYGEIILHGRVSIITYVIINDKEDCIEGMYHCTSPTDNGSFVIWN